MFQQLLSSALLFIAFVITFHLVLLTAAGFFRRKAESIPGLRSRKTAVFLSAGIDPLKTEAIINTLNKLDYPKGYLSIAVMQENDSEIPFTRKENILYASGKNMVQNFRGLMNQMNDAYEIAIFISDEQAPSPGFINAINSTFQAGHSFLRFQSATADHSIPAGDLLRKQLAEGGFSALGLSVPLDGYGFALPYLWVKQHADEMQEQNSLIEGFQRMLNREHKKVRLAGDAVQLISKPVAMKRVRFSIVASLTSLVRGLIQLFKGRAELLVSSLWHLQPGFIMTTCFLFIVTLITSKGLILLTAYSSSVMILMLQNKNIRSGDVFRASVNGNKKHLRILIRKMRTAKPRQFSHAASA